MGISKQYTNNTKRSKAKEISCNFGRNKTLKCWNCPTDDMASAADPEEALRSTSAKANYQRLSRLLMCGGLSLLREKFDSFHSPADLPIKLSDPAVQALLRSAKLTTPQWNSLYPSPGVYGKSTDFDITLTFRLLRTICNLTPPPVTEWDKLPGSTDHSLEADLARVKYYRNEVYAHSKTMEMSDAEFVILWREISQALLRIAASISPAKRDDWREVIDKFLHDPLTPAEERYVEELHQWYKQDMDVKDAMEHLQLEVRDLREDMRQAVLVIVNTVERLMQGGIVINFTPCAQVPQATGGSAGVCTVPIAPRDGQEAGETQGNQQNLPTERQIWNVILNSVYSFFQYLRNKLNVLVRGHDLGSLLITVECSSMQILKGLWKDYRSGHLNEVAQETLVTAEVLEKLGLTEVKIKTFISEEEYKKGKQIFIEKPVPSQQTHVLEGQAAREPQGSAGSGSTLGEVATPSGGSRTSRRVKAKSKKMPALQPLFSLSTKEGIAHVLPSPPINQPLTSPTGDPCAQVFVLFEKVKERERLYFDVTVGKLVMSKPDNTGDKVIAIDMNTVGSGGFFCLFFWLCFNSI